MLFKVADIEERHMRARTKTLDFPARAGLDSGGGRFGRLHGHCAFAARSST
jgi:hypothetical protein